MDRIASNELEAAGLKAVEQMKTKPIKIQAINDSKVVTHHDLATRLINLFETADGTTPVAADGAIYRCASGVWNRVEQQKIEVAVARHFNGEKSCRRKTDYSQIARHTYDLIEDPEFFNDAPIGVAIPRGFVTIESGEIKTLVLKPEHRQRYQLSTDPEQGPLPRFSTALDRWLAGDDLFQQSNLLQEVFGAVLLNIMPRKQKVALFFGPSATGKSSTQKVLAELVPKKLHSATSPFSWDREYNIAALAGKRLNMVGELPDDQPIPSADFKRVTGGDVLQGRHPTHRPFEFTCTASHIFNSNHLIYTRDRDDSFFRRWLILHFRGQVPEAERRDEYETEIIREELPQILHWAITGAQRVLKDGFTATPSHKRLMRKWRHQSNTVLEFLNDSDTVELGAGRIQRSEFYKPYSDWCHDSGRKPLGRYKAIEELSGSAVRDDTGIKVIKLEGIYWIDGIRLRWPGA